MRTRDIVEYTSIGRVGLFLDAFEAINRQHPRDREVMNRWLMGYTQREIGEIVGVSERHAGRIIQNVMSEMR